MSPNPTKTTFLSTYRKEQSQEQTHFCPGCGHGNILKYADEAIIQLGIERKTIWVSPVGCGGLTDSYLSLSHILSAHGRASAVATAVKRINPDSIVIVSQGDGDLASIGLAEAIHAANRGENLTLLFVNNANFAMTGGQMAPTSMVGQRTSTSPDGRTLEEHGAPLRMCELLNQLEGPAFIARVAIGTVPQMKQARDIIHKAIQNQVENRGYSFVEILSPCPSNWHCTPVEARQRIQQMCKTYPTGIFRDESRSEWIKHRHTVQEYSPDLVTPPFNLLAKPVHILDTPVIQIDPLDIFSLCCAGFGGQGILTLGKLFAQLALVSGLQATWIPSYGPEMRGGVANCHVCISKHEIISPIVDHPHTLIAMNQPSLDTLSPKIPSDGLILVDSDSASIAQAHTSTRIIQIPATTIASQTDTPRSANLVMLGALLRYANLCNNPSLDSLTLNSSQKNAIRKGFDFGSV